VLNAQGKLVGALCNRARTYAGYIKTLKTQRDARTVRLVLGNARDIDRIFPFYPEAFKEYRQAGYKIRPATKPAG
jgi:hypothetical protein